MLIGVSGKIGSGKDLIGEIIQYLTTYVGRQGIRTFESSRGKTDKDGYGYAGFGIYNSKFTIRKFADKLKDIVCILIDCTREQLEDRVFKETELGEEWRKWCCTGSNSGWFNTKEGAIIDAENYYLYIKEYPDRYTITYEAAIEKSIHSKIFTPRMLLQEIGTNLFRDRLHPDCWINATLVDYKVSEDYQVGTTPENLKWVEGEYPDWVITDLRFPNEAKAIKDRNGITIRVNRPNMFDAAIKSLAIEHESETALDDYKFDYVIENNGTIEDLIIKVKEILIKEEIL